MTKVNPIDQQGINLSSLLSQSAEQATAIANNRVAGIQRTGELTAANVAVKANAEADAIAKMRAFSDSIGFDFLMATKPQQFIEASDQAAKMYAGASKQLADLNAQASTSFFDSPLTWLGNQITFDDDFKAAETGVKAAVNKSQEANIYKDQIATLNNMNQEHARTRMAIAQTQTAETAKNAAEIAKLQADDLADQAKLEALRAGNDMRIQSLNIMRGVENDQMARRRMALEEEAARDRREARAERLANMKVESEMIDTMWKSVETGAAKSNKNLAIAKPRNKAELELVLKTRPEIAAFSEIGNRYLSGFKNAFGDSQVEILHTISTMGVKGPAGNERVFTIASQIYQEELAKAQAVDPKTAPQVAAKATQARAEQILNADMNPQDNILRLPSPQVALTYPNADPDVKALQQRLLANPAIQSLATGGVLATDKQLDVTKQIAHWYAQNGKSPSEAAETAADLAKLTGAYHMETLSQAGINPAAVTKIMYRGQNRGTYNPAKEEDQQKQMWAMGIFKVRSIESPEFAKSPITAVTQQAQQELQKRQAAFTR